MRTRLNPARREIWALTKILRIYISDHRKLAWVEPIVFCFLGTVIGLLIVLPVNVQQALAAGIGWTALVSVKDTSHANARRR